MAALVFAEQQMLACGISGSSAYPALKVQPAPIYILRTK
jgi:hypothetical protein